MILLGISLFFFFLPRKEKSLKKRTVEIIKRKRYTYHPLLGEGRHKIKVKEEKKKEKERKEEEIETIKLENIIPQERRKIEEEIEKENKEFDIKPTLKEIEDLKKKRVILY